MRPLKVTNSYYEPATRAALLLVDIQSETPLDRSLVAGIQAHFESRASVSYATLAAGRPLCGQLALSPKFSIFCHPSSQSFWASRSSSQMTLTEALQQENISHVYLCGVLDLKFSEQMFHIIKRNLFKITLVADGIHLLDSNYSQQALKARGILEFLSGCAAKGAEVVCTEKLSANSSRITFAPPPFL